MMNSLVPRTEQRSFVQNNLQGDHGRRSPRTSTGSEDESYGVYRMQFDNGPRHDRWVQGSANAKDIGHSGLPSGKDEAKFGRVRNPIRQLREWTVMSR